MTDRTTVDPDGATARDLAEALRAMRDYPGLTRALIDPVTSDDDKAALIDRVFAGLCTGARAALKESAAREWKSTNQYLAEMETLSVNAVWQWAETAGDVSASLDDLFSFGQLVAHNHEVRRAVTDRNAGLTGRQDLVRTLLAGRVTEPALQLALASVASRAGTIDEVLRAFQQIGADRMGARLAVVTVAKPMPTEQKLRLGAALTEHFATKIIIQEIVDPEVLGGIRVESGAEVIDSTMAARLKTARRDFA